MLHRCIAAVNWSRVFYLEQEQKSRQDSKCERINRTNDVRDGSSLSWNEADAGVRQNA